MNPIRAEFQNNFGQILKSQFKFDEAAARFQRALELDPNFSDAHVNYSDVLLIKGDFERGWPEYEWRWKTERLPVRNFRQPIWTGQPTIDSPEVIQLDPSKCSIWFYLL